MKNILKFIKNYLTTNFFFKYGNPIPYKISETKLKEMYNEGLKEKGIDISMPIVKKLLDKHGYVKRKAQKQLAIGRTENRNEQFENIKRLKEEYSNVGEPIISIDTKKKSILATSIERVNSTQQK